MTRILPTLAVIATLIVVAACSGDDGGSTPADGSGGAAETSATVASSDAANGSSGGGAETEDFDVCALLDPAELADASGVEITAEHVAPASPFPPFFSCRYQTAGLLLDVDVSIFESEAGARASVEFGADDWTEIEGLGDLAYATQPQDDLVVVRGEYTLGLGIYQFSDDPEVELDLARALAELILPRMP
jgi:hypothetical protein